ncbi:MAG: hypothetical protein LUH22_10080 [Bacteroides sp.]|nr:hypothetical protein [Bacteroides sp.]
MNKSLKILINIAILLVVAGFIWYMVRSVNKDETTYAETRQETPFNSRYKKISSFDLPQDINRFELHNGKLYISTGQSVYICDSGGNQLASFTVKEGVRDITVGNNRIYVLYPTFIEAYSEEGVLVHEWEACSELSDYCSFALAGDFVFVTDAENKNICQYTTEGNFVRFIKSPRDFIIPSYSFDIESRNDTIYCVNSGRHLVESYTLDGKFIAAFGGPGGEAGFFAGCCNPAYITFTPNGEMITSEKGNPRVSSFERNGTFREVILNSRLLGGGNKAYEVQTDGSQLFAAGKKTINIFQLPTALPDGIQ